MSDIKLFNVRDGATQELQGTSIAIEKTLQTLIESHLDVFLGVRFLATEYVMTDGRIDTLGIDEDGNPIVIEYKRAISENVINQGLFYLDWLVKHKGDFEVLVWKKLGRDTADSIDWSNPRLICIASDFTKYDEHAIHQIDRNIDLIRYRRYGNDLLLFELVNVTTAQNKTESAAVVVNNNGGKSKSQGGSDKTVVDYLEQSPAELRDRYETLKAFLLALGDDVQLKELKQYFAFRRIKNFASVVVQPAPRKIIVWAKVDPTSIQLEPGFTRDVSNLGHHGTGDLEITIQNDADLERAKALVLKSYEVS